MSASELLSERLARLRDERAYRNYERVRGEVLCMKTAESATADRPSAYWRDELANFDYMLDASPLIVEKLRHHMFHITGVRAYEYRSGANRLREGVVDKLSALRELDRNDLEVSESPELGGFGFEVDGKLYNLDTLKFYEGLIALEKAEVLHQFRHANRRVVVEIGPGWGGFAYGFRTLFPNTCYVLIDLPELFLFSAVYLASLFPEAKLAFWDHTQPLDPHEIVEYDFVFVPNTAVPDMRIDEVALGINMVSFQEMTTAQVRGYVDWLHGLGCRFLYSLNRDTSQYNAELTSVREIMATRYWLREVSLLPLQYTTLATRAELERKARKTSKPPAPDRGRVYRHVVGWQRILATESLHSGPEELSATEAAARD